MQSLILNIQKIPRYVRFLILALIAVLVNLPLALLLMWLLYPEWSRRAKIIVTIIALILGVYQVVQYLNAHASWSL
ncbi:hypothetical protein A3I56_00815 [Candidatus Roizmanbacteria bacterium RIFCSPLOWO2_02_FULL_43_10]|uniref:ABC transmembrane type-1 domain-containing protein n=2 Tax=Candidatus Roizmaniibacteriota TaxID=1752723 RepID=A0A1F7K122_9BACT|nr:MAG: hypothetical protein A3D08_02210 [Candidatus Roizmanbacteria bacterium RIFCSPHIGHO2_02_FULL_43_11]OGK61558.1 MAG: hypothetical protein A3I56_00815 [Candidatus Roizmanbacteria bacterium RIFCSPLOWO2_02_FULL_43_10]